MDLSLITAMIGAQTGLTQLAVAGSMLKMNTEKRVGGEADRLRAAEFEFARQRRARHRNEPQYQRVATIREVAARAPPQR